MIRVEEFHISVPLTLSSVVNLTRINNKFYVGPYKTEKTGIFLHTSEVDYLPLSSLPRFPKALSNGLNFFLEKKNFLFSITDDIFLEGTNTTQGIKLHSRKWEIQLNSAKKTVLLFQKIADQMIISRCKGVKEATIIQEMSAKMACLTNVGEEILSNWSLATIQKVSQVEDLGMLTYILGMRELIQLSCQLEGLYKMN